LLVSGSVATSTGDGRVHITGINAGDQIDAASALAQALVDHFYGIPPEV
jgi:hypothetical protein